MDKAEKFEKQILKDVSLDGIGPKVKRPRGPVDHWTPVILHERGEYLKKLAKNGNGAAGETLHEFPQHYAMLSFRDRGGEADTHENFADLFVVVAGVATLITGGTIVGAHTVKPGEIRGSAIEGGTSQQIRAGDIIHIPAGTPHQTMVSSEITFTNFVMKIQETA
jgi:mannose-6-phosphate isomerase-like protein (cupin superfamily)